jgi:hypothetical protein
VHRVRQFGQALGAWLQPGRAEDEAAVRDLRMPAAAVSLFEAMPRHDRHHALRVVRSLKAQGRSQPELLAAALLHDVGKSGQWGALGAPNGQGSSAEGKEGLGRVRLWHRAATVLLRATWPGLLERIGRDAGRGNWRIPFYVQRHHAAIGARLAARAGCSPATVALIRHHEDAPAGAGDEWLAALRAADDEN